MKENSQRSDRLVGGCACGHVRYRLESAPIVVHGCHCRYCQRMSGSAFAVNAMIEADRLTLISDGKPDAVHTPSTLPAGQIIYRCPHCFVALWSHHSLLGETIPIVFAGTLDDASQLAPDVHCFTATKHAWVALPEGIPAFEGDYDSELVWSAEAKSRVELAFRGEP
jgi:hypothetical protein